MKSFIAKTASVISSFSLTAKIVFGLLTILAVTSAFSAIAAIDKKVSIVVPGYGGDVVEGVIGAPKIINPVLEITGTTRDIVGLVFAGLVEKGDAGGYRPILAESIELAPAASPNFPVGDVTAAQQIPIQQRSQTYVFKLRHNATFHDGKPVTPEDVAFTIDIIKNPAIRSPLAAQFAGVTYEIVDDRTITVTYPPSLDPLELATVGVLPKHIYAEIPVADFGLAEYHTNPIGAGAFHISSINRDSQGIPVSLQLRRFSEFAPGKAYIRSFTLNFYKNEQSLVNAYNNGDINSVGGLSPQSASELLEDEESTAKRSMYTLPRVFALFFNQSRNRALADIAVREALSIAAPREQIVSDVLAGFGTAAASPLPGELKVMADTSAQEALLAAASTSTSTLALASSLRSIDSDTTESLDAPYASTTAEIAEFMLDKAGYVMRESGVRSKKVGSDEIPLTLTITTASTPDLEAAASLLKEAWESIGVQVSLRMFEPGDLNQNVIRKRDYDSLLFGQVIAKDSDLYAFWHSTRRSDPGLNVAMYSNAKVDRALDELSASSTLSIAARSERLLAIETQIMDDMPAVFLYSPSYIYISPIQYTEAFPARIEAPAERLSHVYRGYLKTERIWPVFKNILDIL
ncbi:MAG TPA: ABC transporter substrate-binding protein [Candidatus Paceibacterota bacterium]|nr:ABC transporter substrate-binding protein [Candidatus Paceibacterota bacterium]